MDQLRGEHAASVRLTAEEVRAIISRSHHVNHPASKPGSLSALADLERRIDSIIQPAASTAQGPKSSKPPATKQIAKDSPKSSSSKGAGRVSAAGIASALAEPAAPHRWSITTSLGSCWDAAFATEGIEAEFSRTLALPNPQKDTNAALILLIELAIKQSQFERALQASDLISRSPSVVQAMSLALSRDHADDITIAVFQAPPIVPSMCFRAFVHQGKVTAVSQLFHFLWFPQLSADGNKTVFGKRVADFVHSHVLKASSSPSFIADVALTKAGAVVMDVHVFDASTNSLLFSWVLDERTLLQGPMEVRTLTSVPRLVHFGSGMLPHTAQRLAYRYLPQLMSRYEGDEEDDDDDKPGPPIHKSARTCSLLVARRHAHITDAL